MIHIKERLCLKYLLKNMSERTHIPLVHVPKPKKQRKPIPRKSKRKSQQDRFYEIVRAQFLKDHPFCQHWIAENGLDEDKIVANNGWYESKPDDKLTVIPRGRFMQRVPESSEIHHKKGRGKYLLDTRYFMAVRSGHAFYIHGNTKDAYAKGYMLDRN